MIVTVLNQKGGVGKTSTTFHLAGTLANLGKRVLVVDNDPQASLTQIIWGSVATGDMDPSATVAAIYRGEDPVPERVIRHTPFERLWVVPGSEVATLANVPDLDSVEDGRSRILRDFLGLVADDFDVVLIDCPSNLQFVSFAALVASDFLVVPIVPEDLGTQGIAGVNRLVARVQGGPNPDLRLLGYLLTLVAKKAVHRIFEENLRANYGVQVLASSIPSSVLYCDSIAFGKPISSFKPKGVPAGRMRELAVEVMDRINVSRPLEMV